MRKKCFILVSVILFVLFIFSSFVSATNDVKNGVSNVTNTIVDGVNRLGSDVRSGIGNAENGIEDALNMDVNNRNVDVNRGTDSNNGMTSDYTADRTAAGLTTTNNASTLWVWIIVAIAAVVIIGLVWYYGTQSNTHNDE